MELMLAGLECIHVQYVGGCGIIVQTDQNKNGVRGERDGGGGERGAKRM